MAVTHTNLRSTLVAVHVIHARGPVCSWRELGRAGRQSFVSTQKKASGCTPDAFFYSCEGPRQPSRLLPLQPGAD